jgi:hypothetical protein
MKSIVAALLLAFATAMAMTGNVMADGALAVGVTGNLRDGSSFGYANDMMTREIAQAAALEECRAVKVASAKVKANCRVVATYRRECVAVAMTPQAPGFGYAVAADKTAAEERAIAACRPTAGKGRGHLCRVDGSHCDTQELHPK